MPNTEGIITNDSIGPVGSDPTSCGCHGPVRVPARGRKRDMTVAELADHRIPQDRLWVIEDLAAFLRKSIRFTETLIKDPTVPQPVPGLGAVWSRQAWEAWELAVSTGTFAVPAADDNDDQDDDDDVLVLGTV